MTKRRMVNFLFDSLMIMIVVVAFFGSLGAWESGSISFLGLLGQLAVGSGLLYVVACARSYTLQMVLSKRSVVGMPKGHYHLKRAA